MTVAVVVPVKAFAGAKGRLAPVLANEQRRALVRSMAERVLDAAGTLPVTVVCEGDDVAAWARARGASVLRDPGLGLSGAVEHAVRFVAAQGCTRAIVAHADLPLADDLTRVADFPGVTLVADRRGDGTNVACVPAASGFRFSYGPGSCARHVAEADRLGLPLRLADEPLLAWDVDVPADLAFSAASRAR
ncbi:MAG: 2-phospho-L-lactate guanylyltransferase [Actinomycetota bacterium]|nr:2-phospho-L-lactate guanylyltransferase [Actinomycetota bacterium]